MARASLTQISCLRFFSDISCFVITMSSGLCDWGNQAVFLVVEQVCDGHSFVHGWAIVIVP